MNLKKEIRGVVMSSQELLQNLLKEHEETLVNAKLCRTCKGICCKRSGCAYFPWDLDMSYEGLKEKLDKGETSIISTLRFFTKNGSLACTPHLSLRVRNRNRGLVDLVSEKSRCSQLTSDGCKYDKLNRPSGALSLIPGEGGLNGAENNRCYSLFENYEKEVLDCWNPYQERLIQLVEEYSKRPFENEYLEQLLLAYGKLQQSGAFRQESASDLTDMFVILGFLDPNSKITYQKRENAISLNPTRPKMYFRIK